MIKNGLKGLVNKTLAPFLGFWWIFITCLTLRVRVTGADIGEFAGKNPVILAFWHSRIFYMPYHFRFQGKWQILVSPSSDGDIINGILRLFGFKTIRGSSFKHGKRALITLARKVREGAGAAMIADGSRGPALKAQNGSIYLAKLTGKKIVPMAFGAKGAKNFNSWDKTLIPLPFSKVNMVFGKPITVENDADEEGIEKKRKELEYELNRITDIADAF